LLLATSITALAIGFTQAGFLLSTQPLNPDLGRLSPIRGWSRLMSSRTVMRGASTIVKAAILATLSAWTLSSRTDQIALAGRGTLAEAVSMAWNLSMRLGFGMALCMVLLGLLDYLFQRWRMEQELRMTRRELQEEHREHEGDPQIRARVRKLQRETAQRQMIREVPKATLVLTNPTHYAVALRYERGETEAPRVIAKGEGQFARRIAQVARDHGIPVLERKLLTRALYQSVDVGQEIPMEFYQAIAEILAYVYRLRAA
jgi:FlhB-like protein